MRKLYTFFSRIVIVCMLLFIATNLYSQRFPTADGEQTRRLSIATVDGIQYRIVCTNTSIYSSKNWDNIGWSKSKFLYQTDPGRTITDMNFQYGETGKKRTLWVLLDNATTLYFTFNPLNQTFETTKIFPGPGTTSIRPKKLISSNFAFLLNNSRVWVNRKDNNGWFADTLGLKNITVSDICFLNNNTVIAATSKGVYSIIDTSSQWTKVNSFDSTLNCLTIFNCRNNSGLYVATSTKGPFLSIDNGTTWSRDTTGFGNFSVTRFGDDSYGTKYAMGGNQSTTLYRKKTSEPAWIRIDTNLRNSVGTTLVYNDVRGDSTLEAATNYCVYSSLTSGDNCSPAYAGIMSENIYSLHFLGNEKAVVSTGFGVYSQSSSTSDWIKRYPQTGFLSGKIIKRDMFGNLFMQETASGTGQTHQANVLKSTDAGVTWNYDTLGISIVPVSTGFFATAFFVDEFSNQHFGLTSSGTNPIRIYSRTPFAEWNPDTTGANLTAAGTNQFKVLANFGSDAKSNLFFSTFSYTGQQILQPAVFKKNQFVGGNWVPDTSGLGDALINTFTVNSKGKMFAGSLINKLGVSSLYSQDITENSWKSIPLPPFSSTDIATLAFDSTGALYVNFTPVYYNGTSWGVYVSDDLGTTWKYAGLDSVAVRGLMGNGNSMYAYCARGAFKLNAAPIKLPVMTLSSKVLDFGQVSQGTSKDSSIKVNNTGKDTLRVTNITSTNGVFSAPIRAFNVAPGSSYSLAIRFTPNAQGIVKGTFRIASNTYPDSINVSGEGINFKYPKMLLSSKDVDFGSVEGGQTKDTLIPVKNIGQDTLIISMIRSNSTSFSSTTTNLTILPGDSSNLTLSFSPKSNGQLSCLFSVFSNASNDTIKGTGLGVNVSVPKMTLSVRSINFGTIETGKTKDSAFIIGNVGTDTLKISNMRTFSPAFSVLRSNVNIAPGDTANIGARFSPTNGIQYNSIIRITSNLSVDSIALSGLGETPKSVDDLFGINSIIGYFDIIPNPANRNSNIIFNLTDAAYIRLVLYDLAGNEITTISNGYFDKGDQKVQLNESDDFNNLSSGVYVLRLVAGTKSITKLVNLVNTP